MDVSLEEVLCSGELQRRPTRSPDFEVENRVFGVLMRALTETPDDIMQTMVEVMVDSFGVGSAGCSVLVERPEGDWFHWPAIAGALRRHVGGGMPQDRGPCHDVLERNSPLLFRRPQRHFAFLRNMVPAIEECLVAPFYVHGVAVGAIWLVTHDDRRQFDLEDLRQLVGIGKFAAMAYQAAGLFERLRSMNEALLLGALRQQELMVTEEKLVAVLRSEIVERKAVEAQLERATSEAQQKSLSKSDFLTSMSHELRTPLSSILGHAQVLELGSVLTERQQRSVTQIQKAGWYVADLINDVLDLAQVEADKLTVKQEPVPLAGVLLECEAMIETLAATHRVTVSFSGMDDGVCVFADRKRLKQVLMNLLSNAIKYNKPHGTVRVECRGEGAERVRISVRDTGRGLSVVQLSQLFQLFNRLGQEAHEINGTGIGLVITKRLTELMGGSVGVESIVGAGSTFWIELEQAPSSAAHAVLAAVELAAIARGINEKTLLCVEDNPANLMMIEDLMACRRDIHLMSATDGVSGLAMARATHPDAILLDIKLPDIDGLQVAAILAADPATAHIPIIACSANALPQAIDEAMEAGLFHYVTKPVNVRDLLDALDKAFALPPR